jgi:OOP family OmpA-OmpF porin
MSVGGDLPAPPPPPPPPEPPPEPPKRVELKQDKIQINEKVQFEYNSSKILEESHSLLDEVASVIKENDFIKKIQVEGHASSEGADDYNMRLSDARAKAVREYLVGAGVPADKLVAKGFGETKPIVSNDTEEGREQNRRVEFNILEQDLEARKAAGAAAEEGDAGEDEGEEAAEEEEEEEESEE